MTEIFFVKETVSGKISTLYKFLNFFHSSFLKTSLANKRSNPNQFSVPVTDSDIAVVNQGNGQPNTCRRQLELRHSRSKTSSGIQTTNESEVAASSAVPRPPPKREQTHQHLSANRKVRKLQLMFRLLFE